MYATVTTSGQVERHEGIPTLDDLQRVVAAGTADDRGWVQIVEVTLGGLPVVMWLHEEGKYAGPGGKPLATNSKATGLALESRSIRMIDWICGDVVFTGGPDAAGQTTTLPEAAAAALEAL